MVTPRSFQIHIPEEALQDLHTRLSRVRWPDEPPLEPECLYIRIYKRCRSQTKSRRARLVFGRRSPLVSGLRPGHG